MPDAGKWLAKDRGAFEPATVAKYATVQPATAPLIERLSAASLLAVAGYCGVTVEALIERI